MYRVIKVLNNNGILALDGERKRELIFLGKGIGFGKRPGEQVVSFGEARMYSLVTRRDQTAIKMVNGIDPVYLEATGKIMEDARRNIGEVSQDIFLPMADHIALAAKRAREDAQIPNPFTREIQVIFPKEYETALRGRDILKEMTGYEISDDEAGFIALHIHSGLCGEKVSDALDGTRVINESIDMIETGYGIRIERDSLGYTRLMSHLYYMVVRIRQGELLKVDMNDYVRTAFPKAWDCAGEICEYMERSLKKKVSPEERGFLGIHIERIVNEK